METLITRLQPIADFYAAHFNTTLPDYADYGLAYGWAGAASAVVVLLVLLFALFRRERPKEAALGVGQHILLYAAPYILAAVL